MALKKLTWEEIKQLNEESRQRSLAMRNADTLPVVVREADRGGYAYTIKVVERTLFSARKPRK